MSYALFTCKNHHIGFIIMYNGAVTKGVVKRIGIDVCNCRYCKFTFLCLFTITNDVFKPIGGMILPWRRTRSIFVDKYSIDISNQYYDNLVYNPYTQDQNPIYRFGLYIYDDTGNRIRHPFLEEFFAP